MRLIHYLIDKRSELSQLKYKDVLLSKAVLDIHRKKVSKQHQYIELAKLKPIHAIDRGHALQQLQQRSEQLQQHRDAFIHQQYLSRDFLMQYLPSISGFKAVKVGADFVTFEGNGRLLALQQAFHDCSPPLYVQVQLYQVRQSKKIQRRVSRVRRYNQLI